MKTPEMISIILKTALALLMGMMILLPACSSDSEDDVAPDCDLDNVTYSATIAPIMQQHCNSCHAAANPSAGIVTANHEGLQVIALDGRLTGAVNHEQGFSPMPQGQARLPQCPRDQIAAWVDDGALDN
jgi:uncharacterized membrane protein